MSEPIIQFHQEGIDYPLEHREVLSNWLVILVHSHGKQCGAISVVLCNDEHLLEMNKRHLNHDYYTDILTFDYSESEHISGDLFISIDRVQENAMELGEEPSRELHRVMAHGVLHLLGYNDKTTAEQQTMRSKEDYCLSLLSF